MKIDIILTTMNGLDLTKQCLESLVKNTQIGFNLIQIDNNSTDGTCGWIQEFCRNNQIGLTQIINSKNQYWTRAANQGILLSQSEILVIINNDLIFAPMAIDYLTKPLIEQEGFWSVGTYTRLEIPKEFPNVKNRARVGEYNKGLFCFGIKKEVFDRIGLLDEDMRLFCSDNDLVRRLEDMGMKPTFVPESYVHHFESQTTNPNKIADFKKTIGEDRKRFQDKYD